MSRKRHKIKERELQGLKYFKAISKILESLDHVGCQRDRAGNRILHTDQYVSLLLLHMFNPVCTSLRTYEMLCWHFTGTADEEELLSHVRRLQKTA